jgi:hypothetical protein
VADDVEAVLRGVLVVHAVVDGVRGAELDLDVVEGGLAEDVVCGVGHVLPGRVPGLALVKGRAEAVKGPLHTPIPAIGPKRGKKRGKRRGKGEGERGRGRRSEKKEKE